MTVLNRDQIVQNTAQQKVWDVPVRVFHWTLVLAVVGAFVTNKLGVAYFKYHVFFGCVVITAVTFRIVWGLVGTHHARFYNFVRGPLVAVRYGIGLIRGRHEHYWGHNPLGALMVVFLLALLWSQAVIGLFGNDEIFNVGPLYAYVTNDVSLVLTTLHRKLSYVILAAVAVHLGAIGFHQIVLKENLIRPMITGRKAMYTLSGFVEIKTSRPLLALSISIGIAVGLYLIISHAPVLVADISGL